MKLRLADVENKVEQLILRTVYEFMQNVMKHVISYSLYNVW